MITTDYLTGIMTGLTIGFMIGLIYQGVKSSRKIRELTAERDSEERWARNYFNMWQGALKDERAAHEARKAGPP